jgi:hypothetical protein
MAPKNCVPAYLKKPMMIPQKCVNDTQNKLGISRGWFDYWSFRRVVLPKSPIPREPKKVPILVGRGHIASVCVYVVIGYISVCVYEMWLLVPVPEVTDTSCSLKLDFLQKCWTDLDNPNCIHWRQGRASNSAEFSKSVQYFSRKSSFSEQMVSVTSETGNKC